MYSTLHTHTHELNIVSVWHVLDMCLHAMYRTTMTLKCNIRVSFRCSYYILHAPLNQAIVCRKNRLLLCVAQCTTTPLVRYEYIHSFVHCNSPAMLIGAVIVFAITKTFTPMKTMCVLYILFLLMLLVCVCCEKYAKINGYK